MKKITEEIIHSAIKVHSTLGPGLLENVYQGCLAYELEKKGIHRFANGEIANDI